MKDICLDYVLPISNKGPPYPFVHPLYLVLGPALLGLLLTSGFSKMLYKKKCTLNLCGYEKNLCS